MTPRSTSLAFVIAAYALALAVAIVTPSIFPHWSTVDVLIGADLLATLVVFAFSVSANNSSVYDPYWSVAPPVIAFFLARGGDAVMARQLLVFAAVLAWSVRLTGNWLRGWAGLQHEDWRYRDLREATGPAWWLVSLLGVHLFPTAVVLLACASLWPSLREGTEPLSWVDAVAALVAFGSIQLEAVADRQLRRFARTRTHPGEPCDLGVWSWSRHPNYLGEMGFWWGIWLFGVAANPSMAEATMAGPLVMVAMFLVVSIPMMERRQAARKPMYADYQRRVSKVLLLPPK
jgi:steroid 5-alpha reductase family enzyme